MGYTGNGVHKRISFWAASKKSAVDVLAGGGLWNRAASSKDGDDADDGISIAPEQTEMLIDFSNYVDSGVFVVQETTNLSRIARMFRNVSPPALKVSHCNNKPFGLKSLKSKKKCQN